METLVYILNGFVGAVIYIMTLVVKGAKRLGDIASSWGVATLTLGALLGYAYYHAVIRLSLPDSFVAICIGYANVGIVDTVLSLPARLRSKLDKNI